MLGAVAQNARNCPACRQLNGARETRCFRCGARLPSDFEIAARQRFYSVLGTDFPATKLLVGICALIFAIMVVQSEVFPVWSASGEDGQRWSVEALRLGALPLRGVVRWPAILSAVFVHYSVLHLGMNSWVCISFGRHLEPLIGSSRLVFAFVVTGVAGFLVTVIWVLAFGGGGQTAGMSGAVFGLGGTLVGLLKGQGSPHWKQALAQLVGYVVLMAVLFWGGPGGVGVNNSAHAGGLGAGFFLGILLSSELRRRWLRERLFAGIAAGALALSAATVLYAYFDPIPGVNEYFDQTERLDRIRRGH